MSTPSRFASGDFDNGRYGIFRACVGDVHAGVIMEILAEGTGGTARTTLRSTLSPHPTYKVKPILIARVADCDDDEILGYLTTCRCPEVN
jgi:hypothetical protein